MSGIEILTDLRKGTKFVEDGWLEFSNQEKGMLTVESSV